MRFSRCSCSVWLALLACSTRTTPMATGGGSESHGESVGSVGESSAETSAESETDTGDPVQACSTEWDCGVGERCLDGACACLGCACQSPNTTPGTLAAPDDDEDEVPVSLDLVRPECQDDSDCGPLGFCSLGECHETTACVEDLDCRADWWPQDRFCVDGLCQWLNCDFELEADAGCPEDAICNAGCEWLEMVPNCADTPSFDEVLAHTLDAPDTAMVVILDVELDGRDDLVVLENGFIYWLSSTGTGFGPPTPWAVEPGTQFVAISRADVHDDGVDELLVSQAGPIGVEVLAAGPSWPQWVGFAETSAVPEAATTLDVDYDGLPDLVTGTSVVGPMMFVEARLGDGTGTFGPLWTDTVDPFEFSQPAAERDRDSDCTRALGSIEPETLGARRLDHERVKLGYNLVVRRNVAGHVFYPATPERSAGFLATAGLADRGVLFFTGLGLLQIAPTPGIVALLARDASTHHALIDHGIEAAEFVEFEGMPLAPLCRGSIGFPLDAVALDVGDFDGDGREDLLGRGADGVLRTWLSRD